MILRNSQGLAGDVGQAGGNVSKTTGKPKISAPVVSLEVECFTNAATENIETDYVKIWIPKLMKI